MKKINGLGLSVTSKCCCTCKHCLVNSSKEGEELSIEVITNVLKELIDAEILDYEIPIALTGGEISLRKDLFQIVKAIKEIGFSKINISTTGVGFDEEYISRLAPLINIASFSIDGIKQYHNWFRGIDIYDKTVWCLQKFKEYGTKNIAIQMSVAEENYLQIDDVMGLALENGVEHLRLIPILPEGRAKTPNDFTLLGDNAYSDLFEKVMRLNGIHPEVDTTSILDRYCYISTKKYYGLLDEIKNIEISAEGNIYFAGVVNNYYSLGNIYKDNIVELIHGFENLVPYKRFLDKVDKIYRKIEEDKDKKNSTICLLKERLI